MPAETDPSASAVDPNAAVAGEAPEGVSCDLCGEVVPSVRRVALDGEYERLRTRHQVRYSCAACFEKKERERTA